MPFKMEHAIDPLDILAGEVDTSRQSLEVEDFDALTLAEAGTKKSPYERAIFFGQVYSKMLEKRAPAGSTPYERMQQAKNTLFEPSGIEEAYQEIFGKQMAEDLPEVSEQLKMAGEVHQGKVPQSEISQILAMGEKTASMEQDVS